ncbi:unnamed protein product [Pleuronectes platessa]|uniref:Uncharacterized protein n=1 Tax=Pleuronectes platessa TaxID=8262 RepID=A0A9N7VCU2_PLEPL|nr:unnamed protein product [Pleuronectes platessa]
MPAAERDVPDRTTDEVDETPTPQESSAAHRQAVWPLSPDDMGSAMKSKTFLNAHAPLTHINNLGYCTHGDKRPVLCEACLRLHFSGSHIKADEGAAVSRLNRLLRTMNQSRGGSWERESPARLQQPSLWSSGHHRCHSGLDTSTPDPLIGHGPLAISSSPEELPFVRNTTLPPLHPVSPPPPRVHLVYSLQTSSDSNLRVVSSISRLKTEQLGHLPSRGSPFADVGTFAGRSGEKDAERKLSYKGEPRRCRARSLLIPSRKRPECAAVHAGLGQVRTGGLRPAAAQHSAPLVPRRRAGRTAHRAKFPPDCAFPNGPGSSLPFSSSDSVEGSARGNNPEHRARKASRKNSDMISESGLRAATVLLPVLAPRSWSGSGLPLHHYHRRRRQQH